MRKMGLEPPQLESYKILGLARLRQFRHFRMFQLACFVVPLAQVV